MSLPESGYVQPVEIVVGGALPRNGWVQPVEIVAGSGMAIGGLVTGGTPGSVLFVDAAGNLGQNNASFFWDNTNLALSVGSTDPHAPHDGGPVRIHNTGIWSTFVGHNAGNFTITPVLGVSGQSNSGFGQQALQSLTTGYNNDAFGYALPMLTTGNDNACFGDNSGALLVSGSFNLAVGTSSFSNAVSANFTTAVGNLALQNLVAANYNTACGRQALQATTGGANTALGALAGLTNIAGTNNLFLGNTADAGSGGLSYAISIGNGAIVSANNTCIIGGTAAAALVNLGFGVDNGTSIGDAGSTMRPKSIYFGTQTFGPVGTSTNPTYSFLGFASTGIFTQSSPDISFSIGGTIGFVFYLTSGASSINLSNAGVLAGIIQADGPGVTALKNSTVQQHLRIYGSTVGPHYGDFTSDATGNLIITSTDSGGYTSLNNALRVGVTTNTALAGDICAGVAADALYFKSGVGLNWTRTSGTEYFIIDCQAGNAAAIKFQNAGALKWYAGLGSISGGLNFELYDNVASKYALNITTGPLVGIATATARRRLDVLDSTGSPQIRVTYADNSTYGELNATSVGNLIITSTSHVAFASAAKATTDTTGYMMIPSCAGVPTGVPTNIPTGQVALIYDTTDNKIYVYSGGWKRAQVTSVDAVYA